MRSQPLHAHLQQLDLTHMKMALTGNCAYANASPQGLLADRVHTDRGRGERGEDRQADRKTDRQGKNLLFHLNFDILIERGGSREGGRTKNI